MFSCLCLFSISDVQYSRAWIRNSTLKDNVLFGEQMNEQMYKQVIKACALEEDIKILPGRIFPKLMSFPCQPSDVSMEIN